MPNLDHQSPLSIDTKMEALALRMTKLQIQNQSLKLEVKDLRFQIQSIKNHKPNLPLPSNSKNNHTASTYSNNQKLSRNSQKIQSNNPPLQRVDEKKKELIKPVRNALTPSNHHNTSFNSKHVQTKNSKPPATKHEQPKILTTTTPTNKAQSRKAITGSSSTTNLQKAFSEPKKSFQFYSFMSSMKDEEKVISIEKLEPSYQNSPSRAEKGMDSLVIEEVENEDYEIELMKGYGSVRREPAMKKNKTLAYL